MAAQSSYGKTAVIAPATGEGWGKQQQQQGEYLQSQAQAQEVTQSTDVDALMRAIQAKPVGDNGNDAAATVKRASGRDAGAEGESTGRRGSASGNGGGEDPKKRYECHIGECRKAFFQKTHLEIHIRAHTGAKPYVCFFFPLPLLPKQPTPTRHQQKKNHN
jgi:hypothetical protein